MPKLNCWVEPCKYQKEGFCSAKSIDVTPHNATNICDTNCSTYSRAENEKNTRPPRIEIDITCDVASCMHNNNHECNAKEVKIDRVNGASTTKTECASFITKS